MSIINLTIFLGIVIFALITSSYLAGIILVFALSILEIVEYGMTHFMFLLMCELTIALFIIRETKFRKDNSPLLKYNPFYNKNVLSKKVQVVICTIFLVALAVRIIAFFRPVEDAHHGRVCEEYRKEANAFINKIVVSHKRGEDYRSVAKSNPFTNDVFVCKVVALLESEYGRVDNMRQSIAAATKSVAADRGEKLQHLSDECIKESSNVVQRINATGIGEINASKMASDFSAYYIQLHQKCCKAVERIE